MKRWIIGLTLPFAVISAGCQTTLDKRQLELIQAWGEANRAFAVAIETYQQKMRIIVSDRFGQERTAQAQAWLRFLETNTVEGVLVETDDQDRVVLDDNGKPRPMKREALEEYTRVYMERLEAIAVNERTWKAIDAQLSGAIETFKKLNDSGVATSEEIAEAKASAQALLEASLSFLAGIASGLSIGIPIVP